MFCVWDMQEIGMSEVIKSFKHVTLVSDALAIGYLEKTYIWHLSQGVSICTDSNKSDRLSSLV